MGRRPLAEPSEASPHRHLRLAIAGLGVGIETLDPGLNQAVQDRYQGYLTPGPLGR